MDKNWDVSMSPLEEAAKRVHVTLQECMHDGLLEGSVVSQWFLIGESIYDDMDPGTFILADENATDPRSLGLIHTAKVMIERQVADWGND